MNTSRQALQNHPEKLNVTSDVWRLLKEVVIGGGEGTEVCGLLGGFLRETKTAVATTVRPLPNISFGKNSFAIEVESFCQVREAIKQEGLVALAIYHSHLNGSPQPSLWDRKLPWITDLPSLILAWDGEKLNCQCYDNADGEIVPISLTPYCDLTASRQLG